MKTAINVKAQLAGGQTSSDFTIINPNEWRVWTLRNVKKTNEINTRCFSSMSLSVVALMAASYLFFPEKWAVILGVRNTVVLSEHVVKIRTGWYVYHSNVPNESASFVKAGLFALWSPSGHVHVKFLKGVSAEFHNGAINNSVFHKKYSWGEARLIKEPFYTEILKIRPPELGASFFVPEVDLLIEVQELSNIEEVEGIQRLSQGPAHTALISPRAIHYIF